MIILGIDFGLKKIGLAFFYGKNLKVFGGSIRNRDGILIPEIAAQSQNNHSGDNGTKQFNQSTHVFSFHFDNPDIPVK